KEDTKKFSLIALAIVAAFAIYLIVLKSFNALTIENFSLLVTFIGIALPIYIVVYMLVSKKVTPEEKSRVGSYVPLYITSVA
ncbi:hypothetical protein NL518_29490, partial [Klebsiella pneumoniae]|nr:hypothetical protein [Klebsiella pneumoniae]